MDKQAQKFFESVNTSSKIAVDLFQKVADAKTEAGLTTNEYVAQLLNEYYEV